MKLLLGFAIGAILGDIFFHLIPESLHSHLLESDDSKVIAYRKVGWSLLAGLFVFIIVEMVFEKWSGQVGGEIVPAKVIKSKSRRESSICSDNQAVSPLNQDLVLTDRTCLDVKHLLPQNADTFDTNPITVDRNGNDLSKFDLNNNNAIQNSRQILTHRKKESDSIEVNKSCNKNGELLASAITTQDRKNVIDWKQDIGRQGVDAAGYLNLIANGFDNFTHGLAIGASFLVGHKVGLLTTFVIFIHEIPHEICDYAILVNSGFTRLDAVKAQSSVSLFGLLGTITALYIRSMETLNAKTVWILPFSAGGFLYIALVSLLPEILNSQTKWSDSLGQIACVMLGITFMAALAFV